MKSQRKLSKAEEKRLYIFNQINTDLLSKGYIKKELIGDLLKANIIGPLYGLIVSLPFIVLYFVLKIYSFDIGENYFSNYMLFMVFFIILIVAHELIHGITWAGFTKDKFKNIEFGIIWKSLNPYCTCKVPLKESEYILGLIMPCIILGIIPSLISLFNANAWFFAMGIIQILSAGGDLYILKMILDNKNNNECLYLDHPTDIGVVKFEKE